jgi:hypothetical protein
VHTRTLDKSAQDEIHELYVHLEAAKAEAWRATEEKKQGEARVAAAEVKAKAGSIRRAVMRVNSGLLTWAQESMQRRAPLTPG